MVSSCIILFFQKESGFENYNKFFQWFFAKNFALIFYLEIHFLKFYLVKPLTSCSLLNRGNILGHSTHYKAVPLMELKRWVPLLERWYNFFTFR